MTTNLRLTPRTGVIAAVAVLIVLSALLPGRLLNADGRTTRVRPSAPVSSLPAPKPVDRQHLSIPCWSCPDARAWPLAFRTDLDMLAPLGSGRGNAALWFGAFAKPNGPRFAEALEANARRVDASPVGKVLPPNDPLLLEAEPWCDQATMRFYPDVFPLAGAETQLPNLLFALTLARSWVHRGMQAAAYDAAMADFRRVVRLGRLLRQEDAVLVNDLVGLACIRIGVEAIYDRARAAGKLDLALAAAVAAGEAPAQKLLSAARMTSIELPPYLKAASDGGYTLELPDERFKAIVAMATTCPDRRFRVEATQNLRVVSELGPPEQAELARRTLEAAAGSDDPVMAPITRAFLARPINLGDLTVAPGASR